jgi:uncharacterized protein (TIGR03118 family)
MRRLRWRMSFGLLACLASATAGRAANVSVVQTDLAVDSATTDPTHTTAQTVIDPLLINPWGVSFAGGSPFWISNNGTGIAELYTAAGVKNPNILPAIPFSAGTAFDNGHNQPEASVLGSPTGQVASSAFTIPTTVTGTGAPVAGGAGSASTFIFATEDGTIAVWNGALANGNKPAITVVDESNNTDSGAVYKGLAVDTVNGQSFLLAANFRAGTIDVFDQNFHKVSSLPGGGSFVDPNLPPGYAPFNVAVLDGKVYVTYALQDPTTGNHDDKGGLGNGIVDVYSLNGTGLQRLISNGNTNLFGGALDSPWGLTIAPSTLGSLAGDLLVGNFRNGWINAFNPTTGSFDGFLATPSGGPVVIHDLWTITTGGTGNNGDPNTLYFTAGGVGESQGIFGSLVVPEPAAVIQALSGACGLFVFFFLRRRMARVKVD